MQASARIRLRPVSVPRGSGKAPVQGLRERRLLAQSNRRGV